MLSNLTNGRAGFYRAAEGLSIPQYRAYLKTSAATREIVFDDNTTGIDAATGSNASLSGSTDNAVYTVSGQRAVTPVRHGVYVNRGKKIIK